jgi:hypothetical protein
MVSLDFIVWESRGRERREEGGGEEDERMR